MTMDIEHLARTIIDSFRAIDREAMMIRNGHPTGLNWYGAHVKPEQKRPHTEPAWSQRLAVLLREAGHPSIAECGYPSAQMQRKKCDVVTTLDGGRRVWIELKAAWKSYWIGKGGEWIYRSYLLHPLVEGLDAKTHTVPLDIEKLSNLTPEDASTAMIVLVGFDDVSSSMDDDIVELVDLSGLEREPWKLMASDFWEDERRDGESVKVWVWARPV